MSTIRDAPDWLKIITGGKDMPEWVPPASAKPPDTPVQADKPRKDRPHCFHLANENAFDDVKMVVQLVCCTCGYKFLQELERLPPPGHGYFCPQKLIMGKGTLPEGPCVPPHFLRDDS